MGITAGIDAMKSANRKAQTGSNFDLSSCLDEQGHLRVVLVHKKSRLELLEENTRLNLNELIIRRDVNIVHLAESDETHRQSLHHVLNVLKELKADVIECHRADLPRMKAE